MHCMKNTAFSGCVFFADFLRKRFGFCGGAQRGCLRPSGLRFVRFLNRGFCVFLLASGLLSSENMSFLKSYVFLIFYPISIDLFM